ncbi:MAG TPA: branched-chain amino acid ABC transporter permease [Gaiellaceae bacterium]|nr:branched-chain amino acid ABC transporter permease [Gaiellaceae bacterium]
MEKALDIRDVLGRLVVRDVGARRISTGASLPVLGLLVAASIFLLIGSLVSSQFAQLTVTGVAEGSVFASLALALVLIYRATEVINFAQGEMAMGTTYIAYQLTVWGLSYWAAFFATLGIAFVGGVVIQQTLIKPVQQKSVIAVVIVSIGLLSIIDGLVIWNWGGDPKFMPAPFGGSVYHVGGVAVSLTDLGTIGVAVGSVFALWLFFQFTKLGLAMRASALRPAAARLVGVRVNLMLALGWGFAAVLGAVAGLLTEPNQFVLSPTMMQPVLIYAFAAAVLGGLESPMGAVVSGIALGIFLNLVGQYVGFVGSALQLPVAFAVLLLVLLVKPSGLFGRAAVRKV